jgi:hypothetical protein
MSASIQGTYLTWGYGTYWFGKFDNKSSTTTNIVIIATYVITMMLSVPCNSTRDQWL